MRLRRLRNEKEKQTEKKTTTTICRSADDELNDEASDLTHIGMLHWDRIIQNRQGIDQRLRAW